MTAASEPRPVWWSPSTGVLVENGDSGRGFYRLANPGHSNWLQFAELPADAVRLVPDVSRVRCDWCAGITSLDDEGMVVAHLRPDDGASCPGSYADDFERVAEQAGAVPDTGQDRDPVMTETTRKLARRVTQYRRESLGWLKQAIRADGEAEAASNALVRERQIAVLTKGDGHVDCAIEPSGDTVQAPESPTDSTPDGVDRTETMQREIDRLTRELARYVDDSCQERCTPNDLRSWFAYGCRGLLDEGEAHDILDMLLNRLATDGRLRGTDTPEADR